MDASQLEQELACAENQKEHFKSLKELISGSKITNMERLRLVLLYTLRYEHDSSTSELRDMLRRKGIGEDQVELVEKLLKYAGSHARTGDLFQNKSFLAQARSTLSSSFRGVENVYTQHKTLLASLVEKLMKGGLKENSYPFAEGCCYASP